MVTQLMVGDMKIATIISANAGIRKNDWGGYLWGGEGGGVIQIRSRLQCHAVKEEEKGNGMLIVFIEYLAKYIVQI